MGFWEDRVVPRVVDRAGTAPGLTRLRRVACEGLSGRVLEIGFGSGLNVGLYPPEVTSVVAVEPSDVGWALSAQRRASSSVPIERGGLDGQALTEADGSVDSVLSTLTLCTIPDPGRALREIRRVLRPGGTLHFVEHGVAPDDGVRRWQHRLEPWQRRAFGGCHLTRDLPALLVEAGFEATRLRAGYVAGPAVSRPWAYCFTGAAVKTPAGTGARA